MDRRQMCVANVRYKKPSQDGAKQSKTMLRYLTYQEIGSPAIMTRATAGIINGRVLFSIPGSENAVRLAMEKLILPELGHLVKELSK